MSSGKRKRIRIIMIVFILLITPVVALWFTLTQPTFSKNSLSTKTVNSEKLQEHVVTLSQTFHPRNEVSIDNLNKCADYIYEHFTKAGATEVEFQEYETGRRTYKNVTAIFGKKTNKRIVIGAHYDTCGMTPGADDNASGVPGLSEVLILLGRLSCLHQCSFFAPPRDDVDGPCWHGCATTGCRGSAWLDARQLEAVPKEDQSWRDCHHEQSRRR